MASCEPGRDSIWEVLLAGALGLILGYAVLFTAVTRPRELQDTLIWLLKTYPVSSGTSDRAHGLSDPPLSSQSFWMRLKRFVWPTRHGWVTRTKILFVEPNFLHFLFFVVRFPGQKMLPLPLPQEVIEMTYPSNFQNYLFPI